jgi:outer membrane receptor protein involved in Fe transport
VGARTADERLGAYVSVSNAFDEEYITWGSVAPSAYSVQLGNPRIVMGTIEVKF